MVEVNELRLLAPGWGARAAAPRSRGHYASAMNERATPARLRIEARRQAVRRLIGDGLSNVAIGKILGVDEKTVPMT